MRTQEGKKKRAPLWRLRFPALIPACVRLPEKTVTASDARCLRKMSMESSEIRRSLLPLILSQKSCCKFALISSCDCERCSPDLSPSFREKIMEAR
ncbi:unnamed protein product [Sphagnum jensenii]|uniref:Uncharacterized protein n=1 Tax=Sphagnum jensenii TaxID=128206 RepID=A0ABP0VLT0_9BRYO